MHALAIDFVQRRRRASAIGVLLLLAGVAAASAVAMEFQDAREQLQHAQWRVSRLSQTRPDAVPRRRESTPPAARADVGAPERVASQLRLPWDAVLRDIELLADPSVAFLSVEAQGHTRTLRLTGEARTMADIVACVSRLRESSLINAATLSGHEEKQAGALKVIRFSLTATWNGPS